MATSKKPTAKQLAARKKFAEAAKDGKFRKKKKAAKKRPAKKRAVKNKVVKKRAPAKKTTRKRAAPKKRSVKKYKVKFTHHMWGNNGEKTFSTIKEAKHDMLVLKAQGAENIRLIKV